MKTLWVILVLASFSIMGCDTNGITEAEAESQIATASSSANTGSKDCGCRNVQAIVNVTLDPETFVSEGTVRGDINGTAGLTPDPTSLAPVTGEIFPPLEPQTFAFMGQAVISTKRGDFTLRVAGINESVPGGVSAQFGKITDGTGVYSGATGTLFFAAQNDNETGLGARLELSGQICYSRSRCN